MGLLAKTGISSVIKAGVIGTAVMTTFSHLVADLEEENFSEPALLAFLYKNWNLPAARRINKIAGWGGHAAFGIGWAALYSMLLKRDHIRARPVTTIALGAVTGLVAVGAWRTMFAASPKSPRIDKEAFYRQLVAAHVLFAATVIGSLRQGHTDCGGSQKTA
jgi:hypothetical protein